MDLKILLGMVIIINATTSLPQNQFYNEVNDGGENTDDEKDAPSYQVTENVDDIPDTRTIPGPVLTHSLNKQLNFANNKATTTADDKETNNWDPENDANWNSGINRESNYDRNHYGNNNADNNWNSGVEDSSSGKQNSGDQPDEDSNDDDDNDANVNKFPANGDWNSGVKWGHPNTDADNKDEDEDEDDYDDSNDNSRNAKLDILHIKAEYGDGKKVSEKHADKKCTLFGCIKNYISGVKNDVVKGFNNLFGHKHHNDKDEFKSIDKEADEQFSLIDKLHKEIGDDDFSDDEY